MPGNKTVEAVSSATARRGNRDGSRFLRVRHHGGRGFARPAACSINFNFLQLIQFILVTGKDLAQSTLADYAVKLNIPVMNWLLEKTVLANDTHAADHADRDRADGASRSALR